MVDILETLQEKYVQMVENGGERVPADIVFFGGDQLTDERARNIQKARMDGDTIQERLEGLWPKNEDWHGIRIAYQVTYKYVYLFSNPCQERGGICNRMQYLKNKQSLSQQIELLLLLT